MFRNLYISVDRKRARSGFDSYQQTVQAVEEGKSVIFFPEGTIHDEAPKLHRFKDGPFRLSVEKEIPLIPITIPYNWIILNDDGSFFPKWHSCKVILHEPMQRVMTADEKKEEVIKSYKQKVFSIIEKELIHHKIPQT
jgi:1-acyl-sn-glycerol-3-phosphate acyltransferase